MSVIIKKLQEKIGLLPTVEELIYKHEIISAHNVYGSYEKKCQTDRFFKSFIRYGSKAIFLTKDEGDVKKYEHMFQLLMELNNKIFDKREEISSNLITSEIFNSLWIEGVRSSKKKIKQFLKEKNGDVSERIKVYAKNYKEAINFVFNTKTINEENLYALYIILSKDIEMGEDKLDGYPYRLTDVQIGDPDNLGLGSEYIKESMQTIFDLIKKEKENGTQKYITIVNSILIHYLFELIHPYYDMNGRMGRLLTLWYANMNGLGIYFSNFSEAINLFKNDLYYGAFKKCKFKDFKYDASYFIQSILFALIGQRIDEILIEKINEDIKTKFKAKLTSIQKDILMNIISKEDKWYLAQDFILGIDDINQGQLSKNLSGLVKFGILEEIETKPKEYKFKWTKDNIKYIDSLITGFND